MKPQDKHASVIYPSSVCMSWQIGMKRLFTGDNILQDVNETNRNRIKKEYSYDMKSGNWRQQVIRKPDSLLDHTPKMIIHHKIIRYKYHCNDQLKILSMLGIVIFFQELIYCSPNCNEVCILSPHAPNFSSLVHQWVLTTHNNKSCSFSATNISFKHKINLGPNIYLKYFFVKVQFVIAVLKYL